MKNQLFLSFFLLMIAGGMRAQTDVTSLITNPGFEAGNSGWTYTAGSTYWSGMNTDSRTGMNGSYTFYTWGSGYGDYELSQTITIAEPGLYRVACLLNGGFIDGNGSTLTSQRLFAGNASDGYKSQFYSVAGNYSSNNLAIIGATETVSFAGHTLRQENNQNLDEMFVEIQVTAGTLTFGIRTEGPANTKQLVFPSSGVPSNRAYFSADHFRLTKLPDNVEADYSALETLVAECTEFLAGVTVGTDNGNYSQDAVGALRMVIDNSYTMIYGNASSQSTVDSQVTSLQAALDFFKESVIIFWTYVPGTNANLLSGTEQFSEDKHFTITPSSTEVPADKLFLVVHGKNLTSWGVYVNELNGTAIDQDNCHLMKVVVLNEATGECLAFINIPYAAQFKFSALSDAYLNSENVDITEIKLYAFRTGTGEIDHAGFYSAGELLQLCPEMADYLSVDGENFYDMYFTQGERGSNMPAYFRVAGNSSGTKLTAGNEYGLTPSAVNTWAENAAGSVTSRADKYLAISTLKASLGNAALKIDFTEQTVLGGNFDGTDIVAYAYTTTGLGTEGTANLVLLDKPGTSVKNPAAPDEITAYSQNGTVYVQSASGNPIGQVQACDLQGRLIHAAAQVDAPAYSFTISDTPGVYIVKVTAKNGIRCLKVIK
jgi:hypothetical protein